MPVLPLPPGCEARAHSETDASCTLNAYCSVESQVTQCERLDSGRWRCRCDQYAGLTYEVEGAPGLQACAVAAGVCGTEESELGDEICSALTDDSTETYCALSVTCSREIDVGFAPDARAWLVREASSECHQPEPGQSFGCQCTYGEVSNDYNLFVDSGELACRPLVDFCLAGSEPELEGDERCELVSTSSGPEGCERHEACSKLMPLGEGVDLAKLEPRYANCAPGPDGGADCYCSTRTLSSGFMQFAAASSDATCAFATTVCAEGAVLVPTGEVSCGAQSQLAFGTTSCQADLSCSQAATIGGQDVVAQGRLLVYCARNEPNQAWQCSCASDQVTAKFTLGVPSASAWEACTQAPAGCLEHLDVHLGLYGEVLFPPEPLSP